MADRSYHEQQTIDNNLRLRELIASLPRFCKDFFRGIEPTTESRTRIAYAYDLSVFFHFLKESNPSYKKIEIQDIPLEALDQIKPIDIEEYLEYISYYIRDGKEHVNDENGKKRKLIHNGSGLDSSILSDTDKDKPYCFVKIDDELYGIGEKNHKFKFLTRFQ